MRRGNEHQAGGRSSAKQASRPQRLLVKLTATNQFSDFALATTSADVDHPAPLSVIGHRAPQTGPPIRQRARAAQNSPKRRSRRAIAQTAG